MCYAAMVEQRLPFLESSFAAEIRWDEIAEVLEFQIKNPASARTPDSFLKELLKQTTSKEVLQKTKSLIKTRYDLIQSELQFLDNEIYDLNYQLAQKERKGLRSKLVSKTKKKESLQSKKENLLNINNSRKSYIYPHWQFFAIAKKEEQIDLSPFAYGHFRNTGLLLEDIIYHLQLNPTSGQYYSLYNSKIESLSEEYFAKTRQNLKQSREYRLKLAKQNLNDYLNGEGIFTESRIQKVKDFLKQYHLEEENLKQFSPSDHSYMEPLFLKKPAVVIAKAFGESVLEKDFDKTSIRLRQVKNISPLSFIERNSLTSPPFLAKPILVAKSIEAYPLLHLNRAVRSLPKATTAPLFVLRERVRMPI